MDKKDGHRELDDFIDIYKSKFGMPALEGTEHNVKDYLFKLIEFKQGHESMEESSCDENEPQTTNNT